MRLEILVTCAGTPSEGFLLSGIYGLGMKHNMCLYCLETREADWLHVVSKLQKKKNVL